MDITLNGVKKGISRVLHRFHILLFAIIVLGTLIVAIYLLNQILVTSDRPNGYIAKSNTSAFDTETINKINQLRTVNEPSVPVTLPNGRINPFVEE